LPTISLNLKSQTLTQNSRGHNQWEVTTRESTCEAISTALLLCDVWDNHWSRGAAKRLDQMIPKMDKVVRSSRASGLHIIHAPSGTLDFYADHPARNRMLAIPSIEPPAPIDHLDPPLPIDDSDHGSDTGETETRRAWTRQHVGIFIDETVDIISDDGQEIYSYLQNQSIQKLLILGVHTNMCILHRTFGIKQMVRWGVDISLIRDLTDTMYNPASAPYVSHIEGTRLVVEFIEKFWCPSLLSDDLL